MKLLVFIIILVMLFFIAAIGEETEMKKLDVKLDFTQVPAESTCQGKDISPKITWEGLNASALAIIVDDTDAPSGAFTHWIIWNIPPLKEVPQGIPRDAALTTPFKASQGKNGFGRVGYMGPCPPPGRPHTYHFRVYGLDTTLDLQPGADRQALEKAMQGHIVQHGEAMATYERQN
jgi:Raf kinase inhibitor-like YbhB/YbcL family protein